ncbi:glutamine--fructose-6-phosphate transaminase (isomerizing) [Actinopolymorpha sp. B9G3]|uniref:glutamine--fructose-6-phosphate transaminase (isomerizing) n=1 Tax=Actinopolymorpha sp. B9G3 TaxID=3158970 RepID=UPI0032D9176C
MCGIVGMISTHSVTRSTVERLATLEYRGYDSYGVAVPADETFAVTKSVGSVSRALAVGAFDQVPDATLALAHTRWATTGAVTDDNSHPHLSFDGRVAIVHNGVITNHAQIRRELEADGITFASDTDSEIAAHLIACQLRDGHDVPTAIGLATNALEGEYALAVLTLDDPHAVYGAKHKSPLVLCHDGQQGVLASDQMALGEIDADLLFLDDGDIVRLTVDTAQVVTAGPDGTPIPVERSYTRLDERTQTVEKGDYPHWMIKEIHETPAAARTAATMRDEQFTGVLDPHADRSVTLVGSGSAYYVSHLGQYFLAQLAGVRAIALPSDEAEPLALLKPGDSLIAVSQSGETFDTLEICRAAVATGAVVTSISNTPNSTQERLSSHVIRQGSGPEICVLSTKSIISQIVLLARLALETGRANGHLDQQRYRDHRGSLDRLPETLRAHIGTAAGAIQELATKYSHVSDWFFLGRGALFPAACESALKFKEVSYRHAEGAAAGFFKHGTISLIDADFYTVALLPERSSDPDRHAATMAAVSEIGARGGPVIGIGPTDIHPDERRAFTEYLPLPYHGDDPADIVLQLVTGQLLAYYCALDLGREIDQPRSLAKSVTVR